MGRFQSLLWSPHHQLREGEAGLTPQAAKTPALQATPRAQAGEGVVAWTPGLASQVSTRALWVTCLPHAAAPSPTSIILFGGGAVVIGSGPQLTHHTFEIRHQSTETARHFRRGIFRPDEPRQSLDTDHTI